uniref:Uncharacterized protein n=1 Tax=Brassica oleracea var. oleracea TaxID=109376 RepID=A0A0D3CVZ8_BRAOL
MTLRYSHNSDRLTWRGEAKTSPIRSRTKKRMELVSSFIRTRVRGRSQKMNPAAEAWPVTAAIVGIGREMRSATKDRSFESMMLFSTSLILVSSMSSSLLVEIRLRCTIVLKMMPYLHCNPILMRTDFYVVSLLVMGAPRRGAYSFQGAGRTSGAGTSSPPENGTSLPPRTGASLPPRTLCLMELEPPCLLEPLDKLILLKKCILILA